MSITLRQSQVLREIAALLYDFLPGSGNPAWMGHVSFSRLAQQMHLGDLWPGGSKLPAITALLEGTLDKRPQQFEPLILAVVRNGITYRSKKGAPIRQQEILQLNKLLLAAGFKFPELWADEFLASLSDGDAPSVPSPPLAQPSQDELVALKERYYALAGLRNRQEAGLALEPLLNDLFRRSGLDPRSPFRVTGEQMDGSVLLDKQVYLIEAKWTAEVLREDSLLVFRGKIEGKSSFTRGIFISINGFSPDGMAAITRGKAPNFFLADGYDIAQVLEGRVGLVPLLQWKVRKLAEEGIMLARFPG